jgi:hypothetical protein
LILALMDQGARVGGPYGSVGDETLGLLRGINIKAPSLGDLFGLNPNGPCDFGGGRLMRRRGREN